MPSLARAAPKARRWPLRGCGGAGRNGPGRCPASPSIATPPVKPASMSAPAPARRPAGSPGVGGVQPHGRLWCRRPISAAAAWAARSSSPARPSTAVGSPGPGRAACPRRPPGRPVGRRPLDRTRGQGLQRVERGPDREGGEQLGGRGRHARGVGARREQGLAGERVADHDPGPASAPGRPPRRRAPWPAPPGRGSAHRPRPAGAVVRRRRRPGRARWSASRCRWAWAWPPLPWAGPW